MAPLRQLGPEELIRGINQCPILPWAPFASEAPSDVTLNAGIQGNHAGSAAPSDCE